MTVDHAPQSEAARSRLPPQDAAADVKVAVRQHAQQIAALEQRLTLREKKLDWLELELGPICTAGRGGDSAGTRPGFTRSSEARSRIDATFRANVSDSPASRPTESSFQRDAPGTVRMQPLRPAAGSDRRLQPPTRGHLFHVSDPP
jgi:hypothetical protein